MVHNSAVAPFSHDGGSIGILLCHGFTGSPASLRPWAEYMARHGYSVRLPLLPGHGTSWRDMAGTTRHDWFGTVSAALLDLRQRSSQVFVFGLSMGGTLSLRLAQEQGDAVSGLVLVNPLVNRPPTAARFAPVLQHLVQSAKAVGNDIALPGANEHCYDRLPVRSVVQLSALSREVSRDIALVRQPTLIFTSVQDHLVHPSNSAWLAEHIGSVDIRSEMLDRSFHVATLDYDADRIFESSLAFVRRLRN